jgi:hypothetical protein
MPQSSDSPPRLCKICDRILKGQKSVKTRVCGPCDRERKEAYSPSRTTEVDVRREMR